MSFTLNKLNPEDIDEKIRLNKEAGVNIYKLREGIIDELKDFQWVALRANVQCQSYMEQLAHIDMRIKEGEAAFPDPNVQRMDALDKRILELEEKLQPKE